MLIEKPKELSWEQAAGIPEVSLPIFLSSFPPLPPSSTHLSLSCSTLPSAHPRSLRIDMDNGNSSPLPHRRLSPWEIHPLARWRLLRLYRWDPALESGQRVPDLRHCGLRREN